MKISENGPAIAFAFFRKSSYSIRERPKKEGLLLVFVYLIK
jgi:hypothetical protein